MSFVSVAKEVYVIGPRSNPYWTQWGTYFAENNYSTSAHHWCGLGVRDSDSGQSLARHTRISSTNFLSSTLCRCSEPHIHKLRIERRSDEIQRGESAPHQIALQQWALSMTKLFRLKPNGPWVTQKGEIRGNLSFGNASSPDHSSGSKDNTHKERFNKDVGTGQEQRSSGL